MRYFPFAAMDPRSGLVRQLQKHLRESMRQSQKTLGSFIFLSRWLQAPLYFGLIIAQGVYVYHFVVELIHLIHEAKHITETDIMLTVLGLIDVVMIANLLIMVIVGGYETFVSRLNLQDHPDQPEWLSHVNAGVLKVKLATALIGISSIHLLKSFIEAGRLPEKMLLWQVVIHMTFVISAFMLALTDRKTGSAAPHGRIENGHIDAS
jgi:uncharacterized protein (TIGR00645 family)